MLLQTNVLRAVLTLIYDYYTFKSALYTKCICKKNFFPKCNYLHLFPTSLHSFYFVEIKNDKIKKGFCMKKLILILSIM